MVALADHRCRHHSLRLFLVIFPGPGILSVLGLLASFAILIGILLIASGVGLRRLGESPGTRLSMG
ncbi:hypothetical protein NicSoilB4_15330 [Arthrobacter sp. NicSoilB4]|nr:hypothetical protein NicSoilB4_15330 [Arthrobacter sp. NicSoilB4]